WRLGKSFTRRQSAKTSSDVKPARCAGKLLNQDRAFEPGGSASASTGTGCSKPPWRVAIPASWGAYKLVESRPTFYRLFSASPALNAARSNATRLCAGARPLTRPRAARARESFFQTRARSDELREFLSLSP